MFGKREKTGQEISLREITAAIRDGREREFKRYFSSRFGRLYNYALSLASDTVAAKDLVQNAFLKLWQNRARLSEDKSIDALMMITIRNEFLDTRRSHFESRKIRLEEAETVPVSGHNVEVKEELAHYLSLIKGFPKKRREVFMLSRLQGVPNAEIAERLGIAQRTVEKHINLALRFLRENGYRE